MGTIEPESTVEVESKVKVDVNRNNRDNQKRKKGKEEEKGKDYSPMISFGTSGGPEGSIERLCNSSWNQKKKKLLSNHDNEKVQPLT